MHPGLIITFISTIFLIAGSKLWQKGNYLLLKGKKTQAVVFRNNFRNSGSSGGIWYPVVRFTTERNEWITQELNTGYFPAIPEGTKVEVVYDPDHPSTVALSSSFQFKILPPVLAITGITGIFFGLCIYLELIGPL